MPDVQSVKIIINRLKFIVSREKKGKVMRKLILSIFILCLLAANANATLYDIDKDLGHVLYGKLAQNDPALIALVGAPVAGVACGPVAVTNSYRYLENQYPGVYGNNLTGGNLAQTAATLCGLMGTVPPGGTFWDDLIWYKMNDIESKVPGKTVYEAQRNPAWNWAIWDVPNAVEPSWVTPILPTWQFIWNELSDCEDLEILLSWADGGHYLTVKSFLWNDANNDFIIQQAEGATFDYIDPCNGAVAVSGLWQTAYGGILETDYNMYGPTITMAVSESIPEPYTLGLLLIGGLALLRRRR